MGKVVSFPGPGAASEEEPNADAVLETLRGKLAGFVLTGYDTQGRQILCSTVGDLGQVTLMLERCKQYVLELSETGG